MTFTFSVSVYHYICSQTSQKETVCACTFHSSTMAPPREQAAHNLVPSLHVLNSLHAEGHVRVQTAIITCLLAHAEGHICAQTRIIHGPKMHQIDSIIKNKSDIKVNKFVYIVYRL